MVGLGRVILNGPVAWALRKLTSSLVNGSGARTLSTTTFFPGRVVAASSAWLPCQRPPWTTPETSSSRPTRCSRKPSPQVERRNSPSLSTLMPVSFCSFSTSRMARSSSAFSSSRDLPPASWAKRASNRYCGRSRLPTWSARKGVVTDLFPDLEPPTMASAHHYKCRDSA